MRRAVKKPGMLSKAHVRVSQKTQVSRRGIGHVQLHAGSRVCVIRSVGGIGDVLMTTPALRELKRLHPAIVLTYAVDRHRTGDDHYYEMVANAEFIDEVIDARYVDRSKYDVVVDISSVCIRRERSDLPAINRIDLFAEALGLRSLRNKMPFYRVEEHERVWAQKVLAPYRGKKLVALHTASMEGKRSWPGIHNRELVRLAAHDDVVFVVFDFNRVLGAAVGRSANCHDASDTNVREMAALIEQCDMLVGPDSGPMHLAGALRVRSLVMFGSIPPAARINYYSSHEAKGSKALSVAAVGILTVNMI